LKSSLKILTRIASSWTILYIPFKPKIRRHKT
jgi:hypothetical protein